MDTWIDYKFRTKYFVHWGDMDAAQHVNNLAYLRWAESARIELFEKSLLPLIEKAHDGKTTHCGKLPTKTPKNTKDEIHLLNLRQRLEEAVRSEDYELAAELRDKIKHMEEKS